MTFHPSRWRGVLAGLAIVAGSLVVALFALSRLLSSPVTLSSFGWGLAALALGVLALLYSYLAYCCGSLSYTLNRNELRIRWGGVQDIIPLDTIRSGRQGMLTPPQTFHGVSWPGHYMGRGWLPELGEAAIYATRPPTQGLLWLRTPTVLYGLSPQDPQAFLTHLRQCQRLGPTALQVPQRQQWRLFQLDFWRDRGALSLGALAGLLNAALFALVTYRYPSLPELLPLHFTPAGLPASTNLRAEIFQLPTLALGLWLANLLLALVLHRQHPVAAYFPLVGGLAVEVVLWVATLQILA